MNPPLRMLRATCLLLSSALIASALGAAEVAKLTIYRVTLPHYMAGPAFLNDQTVLTGTLLGFLLKKDGCIVETIGEAKIDDEAFASDKTHDVHYLLEGKDGEFSLHTAERKAGWSFSGTVKAQGDQHAVALQYFHSFVKSRAPLGFAKDLAPDLAIGLPQMDTTTVATSVHARSGIPVMIAGMSHQDPGDSVLTFLVIE